MTKQSDLDQLEREVAEARTRVLEDVRQLRQPHVVAEAKDELMDRGRSLKDDLVARARETANDQVSGLVENVKQRVMGNPAAALAIGAGIAWHLYKRPPVTTLLIGVGVASLLRQPAPVRDVRYEPYARRRPSTYVPGGVAGYGYPVEPDAPGTSLLDRSRETFEQLSDKVGEWAREAGETAAQIPARAGEAAQVLAERVGEVAGDARQRAGEAAGTLMQRASVKASEMTEVARSRVADWQQDRGRMAGGLGETASSRALALRDSLADPKTSDALLLGAAGLAVGAALGLAVTRGKSHRNG